MIFAGFSIATKTYQDDGCVFATPFSSLSSSLPDEIHDALLLLAGLEPSIHWRGECGEPDKLISTKAALHSSICSSPRYVPIYKSLSCEYDGLRLRDLNHSK